MSLNWNAGTPLCLLHLPSPTSPFPYFTWSPAFLEPCSPPNSSLSSQIPFSHLQLWVTTASYIPAVLPSCTWLYPHRFSSLSLTSTPIWDLCISSPFTQCPWLRPTPPQSCHSSPRVTIITQPMSKAKHFKIYKNSENLFPKNCYYRNGTK